jgi:acylphosphatase
MTIARRLVIRGRVQGVGYRYAAVEAAEREGVCGWVRNLRDGGVEALVQGDDHAVERMIAWCRVGPRGARVTSVETQTADVRADFSGFTITH